jgi:hypothetical protein
MKRYLLFFVLPALLLCCKKGPATEGGEVVDIHDFIELFRPISLPLQFSDTMLTHNGRDSGSIGYKTFLRFVPDTVLSNHFGKTGRPKIFSLGKVAVKNNETYLFIKALTASRKIAYLLCFDRANKFVCSLPLMVDDGESGTSRIAGMDNKYTISTIRQHRSSKGELFYKKAVYVYNDVGVFTLILMESNETNPKTLQIINPIEALPRKHKFSGDYVQDKRNFISVRDGKTASNFLFFVHFEKDNGDCKGELKGEAKLISPVTAQYKANADHCTIQFIFSENNNLLHMKELEGCGNHRDIKCYFEGLFPKQKETKQKTGKKKTSDES